MPATKNPIAAKLARAAKKLCKDLDEIEFGEPVTHVYNPLKYAWKAHQAYLDLAADKDAKVLFMGMNPGPWGMAQTGVPFGEIAAARDWMGINAKVGRPENEHPKRVIEGFQCERSEVSGRRLWGLFQERYPAPTDFFREHFVTNYCPLVFMEASSRNRTPDKLPAGEREPLDRACDAHLKQVIKILDPDIVVGVGAYAEKCLQRCISDVDHPATVTRILHPSPASPAANKDWAGTATKQLIEAGIWSA